MRAALIQLNSGPDPAENLPVTQSLVAQAAGQGAGFVLTPEVTNCVSTSRAHQVAVLRHQDDDPTLLALREQAHALGIWVSIGSLAIKTDDPDGRFANRSFLIGPDGSIAAWYDKIHMFDVTVSAAETYRESAGYRPGDRAVVAQTPFANIGMSICYDMRFPYLYHDLAQAGADVLLMPSAFSPVTGAAHWQTLLRARAIETGCFVLAAAQTGDHGGRKTYGHSLAVSPWGDVLADGGDQVGITMVDLDLSAVSDARKRIPALAHARPYKGP